MVSEAVSNISDSVSCRVPVWLARQHSTSSPQQEDIQLQSVVKWSQYTKTQFFLFTKFGKRY